MPLLEYTLDGPVDRVAVAIERLRSFEPPEGYWLAHSGGKDSCTIYRLAEMAGVRFDAHYQVTTVDPPELLRFIRAHYPTVAWERPDMTMWQLIVKEGGPPSRLMRYCCRHLKERGGDGRLVLTGVRWAESAKRKTRAMAEACYTGRKHYLHPIIDWSNDDVWEFIHREGLPYCSLYDEGFKRLGCVMCPMGNTRSMQREAARWPTIYRAYVRAFDKMIAACAAKGKPRTWATGEECMKWWIGANEKIDDDQMVLFG